jgi:hypothetical protein
MTYTPPADAQAWFNSLDVGEKGETVKVYHAMWKTYQAGTSEAEWKDKSLEQKLEDVEKFSLVVAATMFTLGGMPGVAVLIPVARAAQRYFETTRAKEWTAVKAHGWLSKRKRMSDTSRKLAFLLIIFIAQPMGHSGNISETFGRGIDNWNVPWDDWLWIWGWGDEPTSEALPFKGTGAPSRGMVFAPDEAQDYTFALVAVGVLAVLWYAQS